MNRKSLKSAAGFAALAVALSAPLCAGAQVQVIDMIPQPFSNETNQDKEPYLAVSPLDPTLMAADAFMPTSTMAPLGPLLVSSDGGATWIARNVIPSAQSSSPNTFDATIHFNSAGTALYIAMLRNPTSNLEVASTTDLTFMTPMNVLLSLPSGRDQPYINTRTVTGWFDAGKDRAWVGNNNPGNSPATASVEQSMDTGVAMPAYTEVFVDKGVVVSRDNYQHRPVSSPDGHIYDAFYRRKGSITGGYSADVVVVRDDDWGKPASPFTSVVDSVTMLAGENVRAGTSVSDTFGSDPTLGSDWWGGDLYLTVDPANSANVYISYSDSNPGNRTLHLKRSTDHGQTWPVTDLLTVSSAKNAAVAVNSHGKIAYLYQELTGTSPNQHWRTHLRRSTDGVTWDDMILSDFTAQGAGAPPGGRIIGDYEQLLAVGKNFYGVFAANNDLASATFPSGVTWQRNKTPDGSPSPHFLGVDGVTTVGPSVDPFFVRSIEMSPSQDFYVRDWTDDASHHDHGQEPSVRADFFSTSDVWNERANDPLAFDANDRPQVQDPQPAMMGHNFAFARVSREATGAAASVSLQYYYSDGGVGVNYVAAAPPAALNVAAAATQAVPAAGAGVQWDLPSGASNHVCLAVEISAPGDPIIAPSLLGRAPGWTGGGTDLDVVLDNNKAQRNMQVFGFGGMSGQGGTMAMYAVAHNAATFDRDMTIGVRAPGDPKALAAATVSVVGAGGDQPRRLVDGQVLTLPKMRPGESRWIEFDFTLTPGGPTPPSPQIYELVGNVAVNGYAFEPKPMPLAQATAATLAQHQAVFARFVDGPAGALARRQLEWVKTLSRPDAVRTAAIAGPEAYLKAVTRQARGMADTAALVVKTSGTPDAFGLAAAADRLAKAGDPASAQVLHLTLLNKLDAYLTQVQKAGGDRADILQTARWQGELFARAPRLAKLPCARALQTEAVKFAAAYRAQGDAAYPGLIKDSLVCLEEAAAITGSASVRKALDALTHETGGPAALQKRHRDVLLALEDALR